MNFEYAARQIGAVWKMARNDPRWMEELDRSVDGVFRSFWALAFALPLACAGFFSLRRAAGSVPELHAPEVMHAPFAVVLPAQLVAFVLDWIAGLTALLFIARAAGAGRRAGDIIIGYNWANTLATVAQALPLIVLGLTANRHVAGYLYLPVFVFIVALFWGVLRRSVGSSAIMTVALIVALTLIGIIVGSLVNGIAIDLYKMAQ